MNIKSSIAVAFFRRGRAKDLSAPVYKGIPWGRVIRLGSQ